jgi:mono/diheme cytochrome c family protein
MRAALVIVVGCLISSGLPTVAQAGPPEKAAFAGEPVDFVKSIQPILSKHCWSCHGEKKQKSGLRLDVRGEVFKGGELHGAAVIAGKAKESPLIRYVTEADGDRMPPDGPGLNEEEIGLLVRWVEAGAEWPDGVGAKLVDRTDHWSFKPVKRGDPPVTKDDAWPLGAIDRFVLARLEREGLAPAPPVEPAGWLRRVTLDLTGLPPTLEELAAFSQDAGPEGRARVVDRLLASPRYGERQAQHWLDVVRYADTHGFEVNTERPNAWPYRDWVIEAMNADLPYDRFVRDQILGGEPTAALPNGDAATGFLITASVLLPGQIGADEPSKRLARQDALDDIVVNIGQTFLGLSLGCARCHDHKFDPISHREYFAMQAFVAGVEYLDRDRNSPVAEKARAETARLRGEIERVETRLARVVPKAKSGATRLAVNEKRNVERFDPVRTRAIRFTILATNNLEPCIDEIEAFGEGERNLALAAAGAKVVSSGDSVFAGKHELRLVNDGTYGNSSSWMSNEEGKGWLKVEFADEAMIDRVIWGRDREGKLDDRLATEYRLEVLEADGNWRLVADSTDRAPYDGPAPPKNSPSGLTPEEEAEVARLKKEKRELERSVSRSLVGQTAFAGQFRTPDAIRLLTRGDPEQPKELVPPMVPAVLGDVVLAVDAPEKDRRVALADWIVRPENPLTARVIVNRVWQTHFGTGLVDTPSDFGRTGTAPSHPELLDWLASEFVAHGWSLKQLHRWIVLSNTYGQSTRIDPVAHARDADVRWLWRYPTRRLDAETIRDAMLAASGELRFDTGGPGFDLFDKRGGLSGFTPVESFPAENLRRMIYAHKVRRERDAIFGAFDCPDGGQSAATRRESTTPLQALGLFNSRFTRERTVALAERVRGVAGEDAGKQVDTLFGLVLGRAPTEEEHDEVLAVIRAHGVETVARVFFNGNEFLFWP